MFTGVNKKRRGIKFKAVGRPTQKQRMMEEAPQEMKQKQTQLKAYKGNLRNGRKDGKKEKSN